MEPHVDEIEATPEIRWLFEENVEKDEQDSRKRSVIHSIQGYSSTIALVISLSLSIACAQALGGTVPHFELNAWRYLAQFVFVSVIVSSKCICVIPEKKDVIWLILISLGSILFNLSYYTSAIYLPVGTVGGLQPSLVIIIVALVTLVQDRQCAWHVVIASITCIVGVVLVTQPEFLFKENNSTAQYKPLCHALTNNQTWNISSEWESPLHTTNVQVVIGYIWLAAAAVGASAAMLIANRKLNHLSGFVTCFWVAICGVLSQVILMAIFEKPTLPTNVQCIGLFVGHSITGGCAFIFMVLACQLINPAIVSLLTTLQVGILFVAQYTILKSVYPGKGNSLEIIGAVLTFLGNVISPVIKVYAYFKLTTKGREGE